MLCPHTQTIRIMCSASCCDRPAFVPSIPDEGRDGTDVAELTRKVLDRHRDRFPDRDSLGAAVSESVFPSLHDGPCAAERQENPHDR